MKVRLLNREEIKNLLDMKLALKIMEDAFKEDALGKTIMPPKVYLNLPQYGGDFRAMSAYIFNAAGIKWVNSHPNNPSKNLETVMAIIIYSSPETGLPLAIIDGTYITDVRTGAAGGIAVKYLARKDSQTIGLIGAGKQARTQLMAIKEILPQIKEVKVFDCIREKSESFAQEMGEKLKLNIKPVVKIEEAADVDILITATPVTNPIVKSKWIKPGTHINAIGADAKGKQELETNLLKRAKIIVDSLEQASHCGEINVPISEGAITPKDIYSTLGEILIGKKRGRENEDEITIFDSTGLAIQDIAVAKFVYDEAIKRGIGLAVDL